MKQYSFLEQILLPIQSFDELCEQIKKYELSSQDLNDFIVVYSWNKCYNHSVSARKNKDNICSQFPKFSRKRDMQPRTIERMIKNIYREQKL